MGRALRLALLFATTALCGCPSAQQGAEGASSEPSAAMEGTWDAPTGENAASTEASGPHADVHIGVQCVTYESEASTRSVRVATREGATLAEVPVTCVLAADERPSPVVRSVRLPVGEVNLRLTEASVENVGDHLLIVSGETWLTVTHRRLDEQNTTFAVETAFSEPWSEVAP